MTRRVLSSDAIHPAIAARIGGRTQTLVDEVAAAVAAHDVVVVGMAQNVHPKRARRALNAAGIPFHYLEYGSYLSRWRDRLTLKMWTGWPTFPMVFVKGVLVGGASDVIRLVESGELQRMLAAPRRDATASASGPMAMSV